MSFLGRAKAPTPPDLTALELTQAQTRIRSAIAACDAALRKRPDEIRDAVLDIRLELTGGTR